MGVTVLEELDLENKLLELRAELVFKVDDLPAVLEFLTLLFLTLDDRVELGLPEN